MYIHIYFCECPRPNEAKLHGKNIRVLYIYLNRRDIKLSYGEIIQFLSCLQLKLCLIYFFTLTIF